MELNIRLPHPGQVLSPNHRVPLAQGAALRANYARLAAKKEARTKAYMAARRALCTVPGQVFQPVCYSLVWYYKGMRPDADNCLARCKSLLDGACLAFGVDDRVLELGSIRRVHSLDNGVAGWVELVFSDHNGGESGDDA